MLAKFQQLYDIEDRAKTLSADERLALRQSEALPIWTSLGEWLDSDAAARVLPKGKFGEALGYLRNHWEPLQLYLSDGLMPIDNNDVDGTDQLSPASIDHWEATGWALACVDGNGWRRESPLGTGVFRGGVGVKSSCCPA